MKTRCLSHSKEKQSLTIAISWWGYTPILLSNSGWWCWTCFIFPSSWEESSQLTNLFQGGSDHQPEFVCSFCDGNELGLPLNLLASGNPCNLRQWSNLRGTTRRKCGTQLGIFWNTYLFYKVDHAMISSGLDIWAGRFDMLVAPIVTVPSLHCWFFFQWRNPNIPKPSLVKLTFVSQYPLVN